jgi:hypothetical protein
MHFEVDQLIGAPVEAVIAAMGDPAYYGSLAGLPDVVAPEVLDRRQEGNRVRLRVRQGFAGSLAPAARAVLDPAKLTWVTELEIDPAAAAATFALLPDHYRDRLEASGNYRFVVEGEGTRRMVDGDLVVHFPLVARAVERAIVSGLCRYLADEAVLLGSWAGAH